MAKGRVIGAGPKKSGPGFGGFMHPKVGGMRSKGRMFGGGPMGSKAPNPFRQAKTMTTRAIGPSRQVKY